MNAAVHADDLLMAAMSDRCDLPANAVAPQDRLRVMADIETGRDQPEPHQLAAPLNCYKMSTGELRDVLLFSSDAGLRSRAMSIFEERIRTEGFREAAAGALSAIAGRRL